METAGPPASASSRNSFSRTRRSIEEHFAPLSGARHTRAIEASRRADFTICFADNICDGCNRMRARAEDRRAMCPGHANSIDPKRALRSGGGAAWDAAIDDALHLKPRRHPFRIVAPGTAPAISCLIGIAGG